MKIFSKAASASERGLGNTCSLEILVLFCSIRKNLLAKPELLKLMILLALGQIFFAWKDLLLPFLYTSLMNSPHILHILKTPCEGFYIQHRLNELPNTCLWILVFSFRKPRVLHYVSFHFIYVYMYMCVFVYICIYYYIGNTPLVYGRDAYLPNEHNWFDVLLHLQIFV